MTPVGNFLPIRSIELLTVSNDENNPPPHYLMQIIHERRRNLPPLTFDAVSPFQAAKREGDMLVPSNLRIQNLLADQAKQLAAKADNGGAPDRLLFCQKLPFVQ
ncbi:MAG: hypothetical protein LLG04_15635, partial [Parachlamydia sp.]|nr:hypothetical protein [Parachlamydia sp.]